MANCTICGEPITLAPSAEKRAASDKAGNPASYYTKLFTTHSHCALKRRKELTEDLIRRNVIHGHI